MTATASFSSRERPLLRSRLLPAVLACLLALLSGLPAGAGVPAGLAPDFALKSTAGPNIRLSEYRSDVVALVFVANWCGDCRAGMAQWRQLQENLGSEGLQLLAISFDAEEAGARRLAVDAGGAFPVLLDPHGDAGRLYAIGRLPAIVLVDREGRLRSQYRKGHPPSGKQLHAEIRNLLDE